MKLKIRTKKKELSPEVIVEAGEISPEQMYIPGTPHNLPPYVPYIPEDYKDGPEGFIQWAEENVCIPIYPLGSMQAEWCPIGELPTEKNPETGKSYRDLWEAQKEIIRDALRMKDGEFIYRLIVLCWMRGEGKSLLACLIQLWKFFCWSKQQIVLGANSKEQITFVHFDIMKDIILNSPRLLDAVGKRNVQEKKILLKDSKGNIQSVIRAISSFSGIVSNITGYTFSEIFDMKNPRFFNQLDGSIRNIPNALGVIDSTVSTKQHILYQLFTGFVEGKLKTVYFSYRCSRKGIADDFWNPNMTQAQLDDYAIKLALNGAFDQYFKNTWGSATAAIFSPEMISGMQYIGIDGLVGNNQEMLTALKKMHEMEEDIQNLMERRDRITRPLTEELNSIQKIKSRLMPLTNIYTLRDQEGLPQMAMMHDLEKLSQIYDTNWSILGSIDRADPMKVTNRGARTIFACMAKGLPGSKSRPFQHVNATENAPAYLYVLLHLMNVEDHALESLKNVILACHEEFDGIDTLCGERWGIWDLAPWCVEKEIKLETVFPTYDKQKAAFSELYLAALTARLKIPPTGIWGNKETDIVVEEAKMFRHDSDKHWFGSPEKTERNGAQDDVMFTLGWCLYGGRELNVSDFRDRKGNYFFGMMVHERHGMEGRY